MQSARLTLLASVPGMLRVASDGYGACRTSAERAASARYALSVGVRWTILTPGFLPGWLALRAEGRGVRDAPLWHRDLLSACAWVPTILCPDGRDDAV